MKRFAVLLALLLVASVVPLPVLAAEGTVAFPNDSLTEQRGDIIHIPVEFDSGQFARLSFFGPGYDAEVLIEDTNGDGEVVVTIDSWRAGDPNAWDAVGSDKASVEQIYRPASTLETGEYRLRVWTDTSEDTMTYTLEDRTTEGVTTFRAPRSASFTSAGSVTATADAGGVSPLQRGDDGPVIASGDTFVMALNGTGLAGGIKAAERNGTSVGQPVGVYLERAGDCTGRADLFDTDGVEFYTYSPENQYFVVIDGDEIQVPVESGDCSGGLSVDETLRLNLTVPADSSLATDGRTTVTSEPITVVPRRATVDDLTLVPEPDQRVTGTTSIAPGSDIEALVRGDSFERTASGTVGANGNVSVTVDLSDAPRFERVRVNLISGLIGLADPRTEVVGASQAGVRLTDKTAGNTTSVVVDDAALPRGGFLVIHRGSAVGPVLGATGFLSGYNSSVRVPFAEPVTGETTLTAVIYRDTNGNGVFDEDDRTYKRGSEVISSRATVTFPEQVQTTTQTPTTTTQTPTPTTTTTTTQTPTTSTPTPTTTTTTAPTPSGGDDGGLSRNIGLVTVLLVLVGPMVLALRE